MGQGHQHSYISGFEHVAHVAYFQANIGVCARLTWEGMARRPRLNREKFGKGQDPTGAEQLVGRHRGGQRLVDADGERHTPVA